MGGRECIEASEKDEHDGKATAMMAAAAAKPVADSHQSATRTRGVSRKEGHTRRDPPRRRLYATGVTRREEGHPWPLREGPRGGGGRERRAIRGRCARGHGGGGGGGCRRRHAWVVMEGFEGGQTARVLGVFTEMPRAEGLHGRRQRFAAKWLFDLIALSGCARVNISSPQLSDDVDVSKVDVHKATAMEERLNRGEQ
ncbi:hypothetical protein B296_00012969 [Ensete ventricosum]|uniref:Uncharacterized protein n=1 Tax=Ensete ventricosum TaxID=4639 RepID=A0A427B245_ENSVE|nr:hypothetical protein B296_00012969 [Ensete ventricosum]